LSLTIAPTKSAQLRKPDFTVTFHAEDGRKIKIGRIFQTHAGPPKGKGWAWMLERKDREGRKKPHDGNATTFDDAKVALQRCWESAEFGIYSPPRLPQTGEGAA
jgi:hypothetical protein